MHNVFESIKQTCWFYNTEIHDFNFFSFDNWVILRMDHFIISHRKKFQQEKFSHFSKVIQLFKYKQFKWKFINTYEFIVNEI